MKILFLAAHFYPHRGGVETHVFKLSQELIKKGHKVRVVTEGSVGSGIQHTMIEGIDVVYADFGPPGKLKKFRIWWQMWKMRRYFKQADVVHCHDVFFWYLPLRFWYVHKPVFITFHGYETVVPPAKKAVAIRRLSNMLAKGSINIGAFIETWYGTKADMTLYGGSDGFIEPPDRDKPFGKPQTIQIVLIGRLEKDIGIHTYIHVFEELKKRRIPFHMDVCGDGSLRTVLEKYGDVHGMVADITPYIKKADMVFVSSYLTIIDALSHGKMICSVYENSLKKDYLCDSPFAAWLCISENPQESVEYVLAAQRQSFQHPDLPAIKNYITHTTWAHVADSYLTLWKK